MRKFGCVLIMLALFLAVGCRNVSTVVSPTQSLKPIEVVSPTPEQAKPASVSGSDITTTTDSGVYEVSNYKEFVQTIGSNREIVLLPGDYENPSYPEVFKGITNLTIIGKPETGQKYISLNASLQFEDCTNVKIENLYVKYSDRYYEGCISFKDSSSITINHCSLSALPNAYNSYDGSGIKLTGVRNFICSDTLVENFYNKIDLFLTDEATFTRCTFTGGSLQIGDDINEGPCNDITLRDCTLLSKAGICATWSNYVPIANLSGFEINTGTETWQENRSLQAIMYCDETNTDYSLRYINTFDGNSEIFNDGKFVDLAKKLREISAIESFPCIDYIVAQDTSWSHYYSFDGEPESKKLVINIIEDDTNTNVDKMMLKASLLKAVGNEILNYGYPVTIAYRDGTSSRLIAYAEFTNDSFKSFLDNGEYNKWDAHCTVIVPASSPVCETDFFKIPGSDNGQQNAEQIKQMFLTDTITIDEGFGQTVSPLFTKKQGQAYYTISAVESFADMGEFMHYFTDMIIKENITTGEKYIATSQKMYKVMDGDDPNITRLSSDQAFTALSDLQDALKEKMNGDICKDVFVILENDSEISDTVNFIFLTAVKNDSEDSSILSEYSFYYYITSFDVKANKVTTLDQVTPATFQDVIT